MPRSAPPSRAEAPHLTDATVVPNIARSLRNSIEEGFMEDKAFIEGQQKLLDADPDFKMLAIGADAALSHFRWVFDERVKAEQQAAKPAAQPVAMPVSQRATA